MYTHTHTHVHIHTLTHMYTYKHSHTFAQNHTHSHTHAYAHIFMHTHKHTHIRTHSMLKWIIKKSSAQPEYVHRSDLTKNPSQKKQNFVNRREKSLGQSFLIMEAEKKSH